MKAMKVRVTHPELPDEALDDVVYGGDYEWFTALSKPGVRAIRTPDGLRVERLSDPYPVEEMS